MRPSAALSIRTRLLVAVGLLSACIGLGPVQAAHAWCGGNVGSTSSNCPNQYQYGGTSYSATTMATTVTVGASAAAYTRTNLGTITNTAYAKDGRWTVYGNRTSGVSFTIMKVQTSATLDVDASLPPTGDASVSAPGGASGGITLSTSNSSMKCFTPAAVSGSITTPTGQRYNTLSTASGQDFCTVKIGNILGSGLFTKFTVTTSGSVELKTNSSSSDQKLINVSAPRSLN